MDMAINEEIKDKLENAAILIYEKNAHNFGNSNWFARELDVVDELGSLISEMADKF